MEAMTVSTIVSIGIFLLSAVLIIIGWNVIYENAQRIASRNEAFSRKTSIINELTSITKNAIDFWEEDLSSEKKKYCLIKTSTFYSQIESLNKRIEQLSNYGMDIDFKDDIKTLRNSITLDCERAYEVTHSNKIDKISGILESSDSIKGQLTQKFRAIHKHVPPA